MPTPQGIRRFFAKRGIPVKTVEPSEEGFRLVVTGKAEEAAQIWGRTTGGVALEIQEVAESRRSRLLSWLRRKLKLRAA